MEKKSSIGKVISAVILIVALGVLAFAGFKLYSIYHEYNKGDNSYNDLQGFVKLIETESKESTESEETLEVEEMEKDPFYIDFEELLKKNGDLIGWIRIDDPVNISYPIMQSEDNNFYLRRLFDKTHNILGSIFMDFNCNSDLKDQNTIIYGHNTKNGSMFGGLKKWQDKEEFDKNPYFYIYTPDGLSYEYKICGISVTDAESFHYQYSFENDDTFTEWEEQIQNDSLYDTGVVLDEESEIVTLSTCTNRVEEERLVVHGLKVKVRECEK